MSASRHTTIHPRNLSPSDTLLSEESLTLNVQRCGGAPLHKRVEARHPCEALSFALLYDAGCDAVSGTGVGAGVGTGVGACFLDVLTGFIADDFSSGGCESSQMGVSCFYWEHPLGTI